MEVDWSRSEFYGDSPACWRRVFSMEATQEEQVIPRTLTRHR